MKAFTVLLVVGTVLLPLGTAWTWQSFDPKPGVDTFTIPAGDRWHAALELNVPPGAQISGDFQATAGGTVDVFVFDEDQYAAYANHGFTEGLVARSGSRGGFSVAVPSEGTYFVAVDHGPGYERQDQEVRLTWRTVGLHPALLAIGVGAFAVGIEFLILGLLGRHRRRRGRVRRPDRRFVTAQADTEGRTPPPGA